MGILISRAMDKLFNFSRPVRVLMLGLDAAGKTTTLYQLKLDEFAATIPTVGFNVENVQYKSLDMTMWDVGGQDKIRPLWQHYYMGTDALIYVVDSCDKSRMAEAAEELAKLMVEDELNDAVLLVLANKQDMPRAASTSDVATGLGLHEMRGRTWFVQGCSAKTGEGLASGMEWLNSTLRSR